MNRCHAKPSADFTEARCVACSYIAIHLHNLRIGTAVGGGIYVVPDRFRAGTAHHPRRTRRLKIADLESRLRGLLSWRTNSETLARRPEVDIPLTREELAELQRQFRTNERKRDPELLSRRISPVPIRQQATNGAIRSRTGCGVEIHAKLEEAVIKHKGKHDDFHNVQRA